MFELFTSLVVCWAYNHWCVGDQSDFGNVEADQCTDDCVEIHRKKLNATPESRAEVDKEYVLEEEGADDYRDDHSAGHCVEDEDKINYTALIWSACLQMRHFDHLLYVTQFTASIYLSEALWCIDERLNRAERWLWDSDRIEDC